MPDWLKSILVNWKTTGAGFVTALMAVFVVFEVLTTEQAAAIGGAAIAFGLLFARDGNVSSQDVGIRPKMIALPLLLCLALGLGGCSPKGHVATRDIRPVVEDDYTPLVDKAADAGILTVNEEASHRATISTTIRLLDAADGETGGVE